MTRKLIAVNERAEPLSTDGLTEDLPGWLRAQAALLDPCWLLAHADDGVIWGSVDAERCRTSFDVAHLHPDARPTCPPLRLVTLQSARLFGDAGEALLWRDGERGWRARLIRAAGRDETADWREAFDESQLLWGNQATALGDSGFVLLRDGSQGLRHVVPLPDGPREFRGRPLRLRLRHYVREDRSGFARVVQSRLMRLFVEESRGH